MPGENPKATVKYDAAGKPVGKVCGSCGFDNSYAKKYCDQCGLPLVADEAPGGGGARGSSQQPATERPAAALPDLPASLAENAGVGMPGQRGVPGEVPFGTPPPGTPPLGPDFSGKARLPAPRKRSMWTAVGLAVVGGLLALGGFAVVVLRPHIPRILLERRAQNYLLFLSQNDYRSAYGMLTRLSKETCTLEDFKTLRDTAPWEYRNIHTSTISDDLGIIKYQLKVEGKDWQDDYIPFVWEDGQWARPYVWNLYERIEDAVARNDWAQALLLSQKAVNVNSHDPISQAYLCHASFKMQLYRETKQHCRRALELSVIYPSGLSAESLFEIQVVRAETHRNLREHEEMLEAYSKLLRYEKLKPESRCKFLLARADAQIALESYDAALEAVLDSQNLCPKEEADRVGQALRILSGDAVQDAIVKAQNYRQFERGRTFIEYQNRLAQGWSRIAEPGSKWTHEWKGRHLRGPIYEVTIEHIKQKGRRTEKEEAYRFTVNLWTGIITIDYSKDQEDLKP